MEKLWEVVQAALHRAVLAVGVLPTLLTLAAAGLLLFWHFGSAVWLLLTLFSSLGSAEVFHRQRKSDLIQLRQVQVDTLLPGIRDRHPRWRPKVLKEFEHGGLLFRALGFEELEIPLAIAGPLCPRCTGHLAERREVRFPGRIRIEHRCSCGFFQRSTHTLGELQHEAYEMAGCPRRQA